MGWFSNENKKRNFALYALAFGACLLIFFGYRLLFVAGVSEYSKEIISGCIGAVITIFATFALLKSQTENEIAKEQLSGIFKEKLRVYGSFIGFLNQIHSDGELDSKELNKMIEWGCKLALISRPGVVQSIYEYAFQLIAFGTTEYLDLTKDQKQKWKTWMLNSYPHMKNDFQDEDLCFAMYATLPRIIFALREDIAHKQLSDSEENFDVEDTLTNLLALHSVVEIVVNEDGSYEVATESKEESPSGKPRRSSRKAESSGKTKP